MVTAISAKTFTFSGRVIDNETQTGLPGVSIAVLNSEVKAITDPNGGFSFSADFSVAVGRSEHLQRNLLMLRCNVQMLDLKSAPQVTSVVIYNLKGERLFFKDKQPESGLIPMPVLPKSVYLMRIATHSGDFFDFKWVHMGKNVVFAICAFGNKSGSFSKQANIIASLAFKKQYM